jgi:subtilase family serine protease
MTTANPRSLITAFLVLASINGLSAGLPDLAPSNLSVPRIVVGTPRPEVLVSWAVTNQGGLGANYWSDTFYVSTNATFTPDALYVGEIGAPWPLLPGDYYEQTRILSLPAYTSGNYFLFVIADGWNSIAESTETNNTVSASFEFGCTPPNLAPVALVIPPKLITNANPSLSIAWGVTNQGIGPAIHPWTASLLISTDPILDLSDQWFASTYVDEVVPAGGNLWRTNDIRLPIRESGTYYIFLSSGWDDPRLEPNTTNNVLMASVDVTIADPDLVPIYLGLGSATTNVAVNPVVSIVWGVTNQGAGSAIPMGSWADYVYLSRDSVLDPSDTTLIYSWESGSVPPGTTYWRTNSSTLPITTNGTYYLILSVDNFLQLQEVSDSNNQLVVPVTFSVSHPDLAPLVSAVPAAITGAPNPRLRLAWGVTNQGTGAAAGYQSDQVLFSTRNTLDNTAVQLAQSFRWNLLPGGTSLWSTNDLQLPVKQSGDYFLLIVADAGNSGVDQNPTDNLLAIPISVQILPPDLAASQFQVPSSFTGSPNSSLKMAWRVENRGAGSTGPGNSWLDSIFLSPNAILDVSDREIYSTWENGPVAAGAGYWRTNTVQIPTSSSGDYFLFFVTDSHSQAVDSDRNNNRLMVPIHLLINESDLVPLVLDMPLSITGAPNPTITIVWAVTNQGAGDAQGYWGDSVWFSKDAFPNNNNDAIIADQGNWSILPKGQSLTYTNHLQIPCTSNGIYYLIFEANRGRQLEESNLANNLLAVPFEFHMVLSDLAPVAFQVPASVVAPPNPAVVVSWCITNQGPGEARSPNWWETWHDRLYLSRDAVLDPQDIPLSYNNDWGANPILPAGGSYWTTNVQVQVPVQENGDYYLILSTDWSDTLKETNETNNTVAAPFRYEMRRSDLATLIVDVPTKVVGPPNPRMNLVWAVTNQGPIEAAATYSWKNWIFFSRDLIYDWMDQALDGQYLSVPLPPGETLWYTNSIRPPVLESGTYYLAFKADADNNIPESNENNNTIIVPVNFTVLKPDLVPYRFEIPSVVSSPPRPALELKWAVTNQGPVEADWYWNERITISTNPLPTSADVALASVSDFGPIPADGVDWRTVTAQTDIVQSGTYYLTLRLNENQSLLETNYANNFVTIPVTFQILPPDLAPLTVNVPATLTGPPNPRLTLSWGVKNQGTGSAKGGWFDSVYFSRDEIYDSGDSQLAYTWRYDLPAGASQWTTSDARLPCVENGDYFLIFRVNLDGYLYESDSLNNTAVVPIKVRIERSDLVISVDPLPARITCSPKPTVTIRWSVKNNGIGLAESPASRLDTVYISTNGILDESARIVESTYVSNPLAAGAANRYKLSPRLPVVDSGRYFLLFAADVQNTILETDESNNEIAVPIDFEVLRPDLTPSLLLAPEEVTGPPNPSATFIYGVTNSGPGDVEGASWYDALYISTNSVFDDGATLVQTFSKWQTVLSGETYWTTNSVHLPVTYSSKQYLFLKIDRDGALFESDTGNNEITTSLNLNVLPPDLVPVALNVSNSVVSPPNPIVHLVWGVTNQGIGPALSDWIDEVYLSKEPAFSGSAARVFSHWESGPVYADNSYWRSENISLPVSESGDYFLFLRANSQGQLFESITTNNLVSVPVRLDIGLPDLSPVALQVTNLVSGTQNPSVRITWAITNQSEVPALGYWTWADAVFLSKDAKLDESDEYVLTSFQQGSLTAHSSYWRAQTATLPVRESGKYYLILATDSQYRLAEAREDNNTLAVPITVRIDPPDLAPIALMVPNVVTGSPNTSVQFVVGVTNQGIGDAASYWWDSVFLSEDASLNAAYDLRLLYLYSSDRGPVSSGGTYWLTNAFHIPAGMLPTEPLQATNLFVIFAANEGKELNESTFANNALAVPFRLVLESAPDLAILDFKVLQLVAGSPNPIATIAWGVTNHGPGTAEFWSDNLFIATNSVLNPYEFYQGVDSWYGPAPLAAGGSYWRTNTVTLPVTESGAWYLVLATDFFTQTRDAVLKNNTAVVPISLQVDLPDIEVLNVVVPPVITSSCYPTVSIAWAVTNRGPGSASGRQWSDSLYLSDTQDFQPNWPVASVPAGLAGESKSYWRTNDIQLPIVESGVYYLTLKAAEYGYLAESKLTNNQLTVPIFFNRVDPVLAPMALVAPRSFNGSPRPEVTLAWCVTNSSPVSLLTAWRSEVYLSRSGLSDGSWQLITSFQEVGLAGMASSWVTNKVRLPVTQSDDYYLVLVINSENWLCGFEPANQVLYKPISITVQPPDIAVAAFLAPSVVKGNPYPEVSIVTCLTNLGAGAVAGEWADSLYVSATPFLDTSVAPAVRLQRANLIPPGTCLWQTNVLRLPVLDSGDYYLVFQSDVDDLIWESSEINNEAVVPIRLDLTLLPDLTIRSFSAPRQVIGAAYPTIEVSWVVENQGLGFALAPWSDQLLLESADSALIVLGTFWETNSLFVGDTYERTQPIVLPITASGSYALSLRVNASQYLPGQTVGETVGFNFVLTEDAPPALVAEGYEVDGFHLSVRGVSGRTYRLLASTDLAHWKRVLDFQCTDGWARFVDPLASTNVQRFYQVVAGFVPEVLQLSLTFEGSPANLANFMLDGPPAPGYRIEASTDLEQWNVLTNLSGAVMPLRFRDGATMQGQKFYRAIRTSN